MAENYNPLFDVGDIFKAEILHLMKGHSDSIGECVHSMVDIQFRTGQALTNLYFLDGISKSVERISLFVEMLRLQCEQEDTESKRNAGKTDEN